MMSKLTNLIKRAILTIASKDDTDFQTCQVSYLGKTKNINLVLPYGLFANPKENGLVLTFNIGANEENIAGIPYNPYIRFKDLKKGEVVVGNPHTQTKIHFKENGDIDIESNSTINIKSDSVNIANGVNGVARLDDTIVGQVIIPGGSSAGTYNITNGKISSASSKVLCG